MAKLKTIDDYGHGGADSGAVAGGVYEKTLVLDIGKRVTKGQKEQGIIVETTRSTDVTLANGTRTAIVRNSGAKYCFSYHKNSSTNKLAHGFEIWVSQYSNQIMAKAIEAELKAIGLHSRGVRVRKNKSGGDYYFMHRNTGSVETLILENLFISNDKDRAYLSNANNRQKIADAIVKAICKVEGIKYNGNNVSPTTYRFGDKGDKVTEIQKDLKYLGYDILVRGGFGKDMETVVKRFQHDNRLKDDGIVGAKTLLAIDREKKLQLRYGSNDKRVMQLQKDLNKLGYDVTLGGAYGKQVENAVKEFQRDSSIEVNGRVDLRTERRIRSAADNVIYYKVVAGKYTDKNKADKVAKELKEKGFDSKVEN